MDPAQALHDPERVYEKLGVSKGVLVTGGELGASFYLRGIGSSFQAAYTVDVVSTNNPNSTPSILTLSDTINLNLILLSCFHS